MYLRLSVQRRMLLRGFGVSSAICISKQPTLLTASCYTEGRFRLAGLWCVMCLCLCVISLNVPITGNTKKQQNECFYVIIKLLTGAPTLVFKR